VRPRLPANRAAYFTDGVATLRLNRPDHGNAINPDLAADLAEAATQISERPDVRAVLIARQRPELYGRGDSAYSPGETRADATAEPLRRRLG